MPPESTVTGANSRGSTTLTDPLYYLHNFRWVLTWVRNRYPDILKDSEKAFVAGFQALPNASQGLLVRMVMRKGEHFRADKLSYPELGSVPGAMAPLVEQGWVDDNPVLDLETLFRVFTWRELRGDLSSLLAGLAGPTKRKRDALSGLAELEVRPGTLAEWGVSGPPVYQLKLMPLCDRFRLMFFGNLHQDWSEFVLAELGTWQYEPVDFGSESRPFHSRAEIDAYLQLQVCRERFFNDEPLESIAADVPSLPSDNPWLVAKRDRLLFKLAREWERAGELGHASGLYHRCGHPEARARLLRVLERGAEYELALALAKQAEQAPRSEAEHQQVRRLILRLQRKLQILCSPSRSDAARTEIMTLNLAPAQSVERAVQNHLKAAEAPVFYVENALLVGLFGLLCWDAVFAPVPGAFFNPFQRGPADLYWPDFHRRRRHLFDRCLGYLRNGDYRSIIRETLQQKQGRQNPFVDWAVVQPERVELALECIPPEHLEHCFERMLRDLKANCAGLPDLIQFWPEEKRYRLIEVKGPGDRLQDNQRRWLDFFATHAIPVAVCHVSWCTSQDRVEPA